MPVYFFKMSYAFSEYMNFKVRNRYDIKLDIVGEDAIVGTYLHLFT